MRATLRVSAIVPTLEEEDFVATALASLREAGADEILVVDAESRDRTREIAGAYSDRVLIARGGLFAQLHRGAAEATGEVLVFHYADGRLDRDAIDRVREALEDPGVEGGAFRLAFDAEDRFYRLLEWGARWRNRWLTFGPFGDQSLFVRRRVFFEIGGFSTRSPYADHELVSTLRRRHSFRELRTPVYASTRRWDRHGRWRTLCAHWRETVEHLILADASRSGDETRTRVERLRRLR